MKNIKKIVMTGLFLLIYSGGSNAEGYAMGHLLDFGSTWGSATSERYIMIQIDPNRNYFDRFSGTEQPPFSDLNSDSECDWDSVVIFDLTSTTDDKDVVLMFLSMAEALNKPIGIETKGCLPMWGWTYPRLRSVWLQ